MNHSTRLADLLPIDLWPTPGSRHLPGRPRHRFVQGQNRQSGPTRHRLPRPCRHRLALSTPATLLQTRSTPTRSHRTIRARFSTRCPLHLSPGPNPVDACKGADQLPRPVRRSWRHRLSSFLAIPGQKGQLQYQERIELLGQFLKVLGSDKIDCLVADREFIGAEWFAWLRANHVPFCIRIRHDMKVSRTTGALSPARNFFRSLPRSTSCSLIGPRLVCGHWLWVTGMHLPSGAYLIVVSNRPGHQAPGGV